MGQYHGLTIRNRDGINALDVAIERLKNPNRYYGLSIQAMNQVVDDLKRAGLKPTPRAATWKQFEYDEPAGALD
jgi:hypothetical protein